jgi:hypothetical protein
MALVWERVLWEIVLCVELGCTKSFLGKHPTARASSVVLEITRQGLACLLIPAAAAAHREHTALALELNLWKIVHFALLGCTRTFLGRHPTALV